MFDYLQQFNKLPKDLRNKISQEEVMSKVSELEKKYQVDLAALVMKVMVKQVPYNNIALYLVGQKDLEEKQAENLSQELKAKVFSGVKDYLAGDSDKDSKNKEEDIKLLEKGTKKEDPQDLINQITKKEDHNIKIDKAVENIIEKVGVSLSSSYLKDRLEMVLKTYIKGVRDKISTRSVLTRSGQEGGLSLDHSSIDKILKLADEYKKSQEPKIEKPKPKVSEEAEKRDKLEALNDSYNLKESLKNKEDINSNHSKEASFDNKDSEKETKQEKTQDSVQEEDKKEDLYKKLNIQKEIAPPSPSTKLTEKDSSQDGTDRELSISKETATEKDSGVDNLEAKTKVGFEPQKQEDDKQNIKKEDIKKAKSLEVEPAENKDKTLKNNNLNTLKEKDLVSGSVKQESQKLDKPQSSSTAVNSNRSFAEPKVASGKQSMQDIRVSQRIMGPIDELRYFNLKNFRRLSDNPQEAFSKIREKIDLLSKESYEKRVEAISAWKENPLNKLYYQISKESLNKAKPINEVIEERKGNNMDYLSSEELKALVSFNRSYMF